MRTAFLLASLIASTASAQPLTTAFTFQGQVQESGLPAAGTFDIRFRLYDALSGGAQVGPTLCVNDLTVSDGQFTTLLDFGAVFAGSRRYMEMDIRADSGLPCADTTGFTTLGPRSEVTAAPNAAFALTAAAATTASNTTNLNSQPASFYTNAANLTGALADARLSANVPRLNTVNTFTSNVTAPTFVGSLSGNATSASNATNLNGQAASFYTNAANMNAGTLPDARLSNNIPRLNFPASFTSNVSAPMFVGFLSGTANVANNAFNADNAELFDGRTPSFYTNASNMTSGTLSEFRLPPAAALTNNFNVAFQGTVNALQRMNIGNSSTYPEELHIQGTGVFGRIAMDPGGTDQFTELAFWENLSNTNGILLREDGRSISNNLTVIDATSGTEAAIATFDRDDNSFSALIKAFRIDHPQDPANKELWHSCVESPDMLNIYSGTITTDDEGLATVTLPSYFSALNKDYRYQLTVIDDGADSDAAWPMAKVTRTIGKNTPNTFTIRTNLPHIQVSWQVTGIRNDAAAQHFRIVPERDKPAALRGTYLCPEAFMEPLPGPQG